MLVTQKTHKSTDPNGTLCLRCILCVLFQTSCTCYGNGIAFIYTRDTLRHDVLYSAMTESLSGHSAETDIYFYHPDHLGSASWMTDATGYPVQHMQYQPYGETHIDQWTGTYNERYTFTGKEKDIETGYYYFGARYYSSDLSMWLSVDPMADKYPSLSPYNYCAWNPIKLIDADGLDTIFSFACNTRNVNQNEQNKKLLIAMRNLGDNPNLLMVSMHGSPQNVEMSASTAGDKTKAVSAMVLAKRILSGADGSLLYGDNLDENRLTLIILYSCNTGQGDNCFGQQLSSELESAIVIAPTETVWAGVRNGKTTIDNRECIKDSGGKFIKGKSGSWGVFYKGKRVMSFGNTPPQKWINQQGGINKVIDKITNQNGQDN